MSKYPKFVKGQKVRCIEDETPLGWESDEGFSGGIQYGGIYTVSTFNEGLNEEERTNYDDPDQWDVGLDKLSGTWHPAHFESLKPTNEERVKQRLEKLNA